MIVQMWWARIRDSLWALPAAITVGCILLALGLVRLEVAGRLPTPDDVGWLFEGGASGAAGVLSTISGSLITVTGVVFSVNIVALQLASSQYSPRVLYGFIRDRPNQIVLGTLIGTFTYALLIMRALRSAAEDREPFVPALAVTVGIVLLLASIAALIYFIDHSARSIRIEFILQRQAEQTRREIERVFGTREEPRAEDVVAHAPAGPFAAAAAERGGYVQAISGDALLAFATKHDLVVVLDHGVGAFVLPGERLARVWPRERATADAETAVRDALALGHERTPDRDVAFGIVGIADITLRALSPSINDPTTAIVCVDRLAELLVTLAHVARSARVWRDEEGVERLVVPQPAFDVAVAAALDRAARAGAGDLLFVTHLLRTLPRIAALVPPACREPLRRVAEAAAAAAATTLTLPEDRARVLALLADVRARLADARSAEEEPVGR